MWYSTTTGSAATIDRWQFISGYDLPNNSQDLNFGWNLRVRREKDGTWSFGHLNGSLATDRSDIPLLASVVDNSVSLTGNTWYAGAGWESVTTGSDHTDFGFDFFSAQLGVPEPATVSLLAIAGGMLWVRRRR